MGLRAANCTHTPALVRGRTLRIGSHGLMLLATTLLLLALPVGTAHAAVWSGDLVDGVRWSDLGVVEAAMPDVTMESGLLVADDGRVLWARNVDERRAMASITKVMTAILVLENTDPDDVVTVPPLSTAVGESSAGLRTGDKVTVRELFEGLMIKSGNDTAIALAYHISGGVEPFVALMNERAQQLGMLGTKFANPHGLDAAEHYTTASDVAIMTRYAMAIPEFREVVATKTVDIESGGRTAEYENTNLLLFSYSGANGVKTGWTNKAGYCVVGSAQRDSREFYAVVLGTDDQWVRFTESKALLDFGFAHYREQELAVAGTVLGRAQVTDYPDRSVAAVVADTTAIRVLDLAGDIVREVTLYDVGAPVAAGDRVGVISFTQGDRLLATVPLVSRETVEKPFILLRPIYAVMKWWSANFG